ncbi:MAG: hypothetical protein IT209_06245 [Armatimonadetes bacterium]|nr:hypothetical protein [Armatimonadota bacterium]
MSGLALAVYLLYAAQSIAPGSAQHTRISAVKPGMSQLRLASDSSKPTQTAHLVLSSSAESNAQTPAHSASLTSAPANQRAMPAAMTGDEIRYLELTNNERRRIGLKPLAQDLLLTFIARRHSEEMHRLDYFSHESPNSAERTPMQRYLAQIKGQPSYALVGENLFYCSRVDVNRGHRAFMNSPGHRSNILDPRFENMGVGIFKAPDGSFYVTEMFLANHQARQARAPSQSTEQPQPGG